MSGTINLLCTVVKPDINHIFRFNAVVAWNLSKAFKKQGYETNFVYADGKSWRRLQIPPKADHTISISSASMLLLRGTHWRGQHYPENIKEATKKYRQKIESSTNGKITVYLDADYSGWADYFDHIFTVVKPMPKSPKKYVYAGWGADPEYFYPEQKEKAVYLDTLDYGGVYKGKYDKIYDTYRKVLSESKIKLYDPLPKYGGIRLPWSEIQKIMRKCHYYCCTALGESGLTRIEAATCGALLVIPRSFYKPRTMASLAHKIWNTKADLVKILKTKTNPKAIRKKALTHSWNKTASRILKTLYA